MAVSVGSRGRNRSGYYVALLYVLDLHYEKEARTKGEDPAHWRPLPKTRPDHFGRWATDVISTLEGDKPEGFGELVEKLEAYELNRIASVLSHLTDPADNSQDWIVEEFSGGFESGRVSTTAPGLTSAERHPQARKFAKFVTRNLDLAWLEALKISAGEFGETEGIPAAAFLLAGMPPSFRSICRHILEQTGDLEFVGDYQSLTAFQFFGLVTGKNVQPPPEWFPAIEELRRLDPNTLDMLASLSESQFRLLARARAIDWRLAQIRRHHLLSLGEWRELRLAILAHESGGEFSGPRRMLRLAENIIASEPSHEEVTRAAADNEGWEMNLRIDEECMRLYRQRRLTPALLNRARSWDDAILGQMRELLTEQRSLVWAYLEDTELLMRVFRARTTAQLVLRELFPKSISWLDKYLFSHLEEVLTFDVAEVQALAEIISERVQDNFWGRLLHDA